MTIAEPQGTHSMSMESTIVLIRPGIQPAHHLQPNYLPPPKPEATHVTPVRGKDLLVTGRNALRVYK